MNQYNVLWFDDEHETLESIKDDANLKGITLFGFTNAKDGLKELEDKIDFFHAIIVDGNFYKIPGQSGDIMDDTAMFNVGLTLEKNDLNRKLPWFILSGQINFTKEINKYAKGFNKQVYDKANEEHLSTLWSDLKGEVDKQPENKVRIEFSNVFDACNDQYLGLNASALLLSSLLIYKGQNHQDTKGAFNDLRMILELLFTKLNKIGLIPDAIFQTPGWFNPSGNFLCGRHINYKLNEGVIHPIISHLLNQIIPITQDGSHIATEKLKLKTNQFITENQTPYLYRSTLNQLMDILIWFKKFIDQNPDIEKNKMLWTIVQNSETDMETEWLIGTVSKIKEDKWGTFQPSDGGKTIGIPPQIVTGNNLKENDEIKITTKPDPTGTKTHIDKIKKNLILPHDYWRT